MNGQTRLEREKHRHARLERHVRMRRDFERRTGDPTFTVELTLQEAGELLGPYWQEGKPAKRALERIALAADLLEEELAKEAAVGDRTGYTSGCSDMQPVEGGT